VPRPLRDPPPDRDMKKTISIDDLVDGQRIGGFTFNVVFWSFLAMFGDGYEINAMSLAAPELRVLWHVPDASFTWALSASSFGILFGAPLLGWLGDRYGRKPAILASTLVCGLATLLVALAGNLDQVVVLRFFAGIGIGGLMPNTIALNSEMSPKRRRATLVVLMFTGVTLGGSLPGLVARWLLPSFGWTVLFEVGGLVALGTACGVWFCLPESVRFLAFSKRRPAELRATARCMRPDLDIPEDVQWSLPQAQGSGTSGLRQLFAPGVRTITPLIWVCFATALMTNYFLNSWLPLLGAASGLSRDQTSSAAMLYNVGGTLGGLLMSVLMDRYGLIVSVLLFLLAVPSIALLGLTGMSGPALLPLVFVSGLAVLGAQFGNNAAAGMSYPTQFRAKAVGWALAVGRFGSILGQVLGGALIHLHVPARQLFLGASLPMLLGAAAAAGLMRQAGRGPTRIARPPRVPAGS
jgi:AAHS family 4-hydroxybenzoate transporter-like MFS transporter